jgi:hypothetical protein
MPTLFRIHRHKKLNPEEQHKRQAQERLISMRSYQNKERQKRELEADTKKHLIAMQDLTRQKKETETLSDIAAARARGAKQRNELIRARGERVSGIRGAVETLARLGARPQQQQSQQMGSGMRRPSKVYVRTSYGWRALHYGENPGGQQLFRRTGKGYKPIEGDVREYRTPEPLLGIENEPVSGGSPAPVRPAKDDFFDF